MSMSSSSAILGVRLASVRVPLAPQRVGVTIECSSRPQKKATKHHMKTRPRKTNPSDRRHGPAVYPPLPPLPSEWTLIIIPSTSHSADDNNPSSSSSSAQPQVVAHSE